MNKDRRTRLEEIANRINEIISDLEEIRDEEENAYENLPESLQESVRGQELQEKIDGMNDMLDNMEYIPTQINELIA